MPVDARIETSKTGNIAELDRRKMMEENLKTVRLVDFRMDANVNRPPDYYLYVFNIAPRKFEVCRPPNFPRITFAGCPKGEPYALVARIPNIVNEKWTDGGTGEVRINGIPGERFATDLLNPSNLGVDIWAPVADEMNWIDHGTDDLTRRGVFWTRRSVPSEEELAKARERMELHYKGLIAHAEELYQDPNTRKEIGREHHIAADYFKVRSQWHIIAEAPQICPNCGETTKPGVAFHIGSTGFMCVIDWKRAVLSGAVKRDDVPEEMRWWEQAQQSKPSGKADKGSKVQ